VRLLALFALLLAGCMFLTRFDAEGQPCDKSALQPENQCLQGFHCENNVCKRGAYDGGRP
jgi:hypothetical protein